MPHTLRHLERSGSISARQTYPRHQLPGRRAHGRREVHAAAPGRGVRRTALHSALYRRAPSRPACEICPRRDPRIKPGRHSVQRRDAGRRDTSPRPTDCTPPSAESLAWSRPSPGPAALGHPPSRADRAVDGLRRGALGARRRGLRDTGRRRLLG